MTKKDYELIANELKWQHELGYSDGNIQGNGSGQTATVFEMSCRLWASTLHSVNPKFDRDKFLKACGIDVIPYPSDIKMPERRARFAELYKEYTS